MVKLWCEVRASALGISATITIMKNEELLKLHSPNLCPCPCIQNGIMKVSIAWNPSCVLLIHSTHQLLLLLNFCSLSTPAHLCDILI